MEQFYANIPIVTWFLPFCQWLPLDTGSKHSTL